MKYSLEQLQALAAQTGFPDPVLAAAVAMAESGGNTEAVNDTRGRTDLPAGTRPEHSIGLWQINTLSSPQYDVRSLFDPNYNAKAALAISRNGTSWVPWSAFKNNSYLKWYSGAAYPPHGGAPIIPEPVTPPIERRSIIGVAVGVVVLVGATGFSVYKLLSSRSRPRPYFPHPEPEPDFDYGRDL